MNNTERIVKGAEDRDRWRRVFGESKSIALGVSVNKWLDNFKSTLKSNGFKIVITLLKIIKIMPSIKTNQLFMHILVLHYL